MEDSKVKFSAPSLLTIPDQLIKSVSVTVLVLAPKLLVKKWVNSNVAKKKMQRPNQKKSKKGEIEINPDEKRGET